MEFKKLAIFEGRKICRYWDETQEKWYFSVVDVVGALSQSADPTGYLKKLRKRDPELGSYVGTNCPRVEIAAAAKKQKL